MPKHPCFWLQFRFLNGIFLLVCLFGAFLNKYNFNSKTFLMPQSHSLSKQHCWWDFICLYVLIFWSHFALYWSVIFQCNVVLRVTAAILESNSTKIRTNKNCTTMQQNKAVLETGCKRINATRFCHRHVMKTLLLPTAFLGLSHN